MTTNSLADSPDVARPRTRCPQVQMSCRSKPTCLRVLLSIINHNVGSRLDLTTVYPSRRKLNSHCGHCGRLGLPAPRMDSGRALRIFVFAAGHPWPFDPRPWMVGSTSVPILSTSVAAQKWRDSRVWETRPTYTACLHIRPPIWADEWDPAAAPLTGLPAAEHRQRRQVGRLPAAGPALTRKMPRGEGAAAPPSPALRHPPVPRPSVAERIASREPLEGGRPGPLLARLTDSTDILAPPGNDEPRTWGAVTHSGLSFAERACVWRVLHGCALTGQGLQEVCQHAGLPLPTCQHAGLPFSTCGVPHCDTLSHVFLTCPLACQVCGWLGTLWEPLTSHRFPMSVALLRLQALAPCARRRGPLAAALPLLRSGGLEGTLPPQPRRPHAPCHCGCGPGLLCPGAHGQQRRPCHPRRALRRQCWGDIVSTPLLTLTPVPFGLRDVLSS